MNTSDISKMHNGLFHCPFKESIKLMPEIKDILESAPIDKNKEWVVDVKVHMLMPNQFPCIPNWHLDNVPRDKNNNKLFNKRNKDLKMYIWVSGEPLTEFRNKGKIKEKQWIEFTQYDEHRGTMSEIFTWRLFIRICPKEILKPESSDKWLRRHSQVYLDSNKFKW